MNEKIEQTVLGLDPATAATLTMVLYVLAALMLAAVLFAALKRRANGQTPIPGAGVTLLLIGALSLLGALALTFAQ